MHTYNSLLFSLFAGASLAVGVRAAQDGDGGEDDDIQFEFARIFFEYNSTDNDLGVHVFLDGEDWRKVKITNPERKKIFEVKGKGPYQELGLTELFFEGAEPSLDEFRLDELLELFPEGTYEFEGKTVEGAKIEGMGELTHAIPSGPEVHVEVGANDYLRISWAQPPGPPPGFPLQRIYVVRYQVLIGEDFQVNLPGSVTSVTIPTEFVSTLDPGRHGFEVLAVEGSGNQSITESYFMK